MIFRVTSWILNALGALKSHQRQLVDASDPFYRELAALQKKSRQRQLVDASDPFYSELAALQKKSRQRQLVDASDPL